MGEFLSTPNKQKHSEDKEGKTVFFSTKIDKIRSFWNARLEKEDGRFTYY
jgi:hypothetical protein